MAHVQPDGVVLAHVASAGGVNSIGSDGAFPTVRRTRFADQAYTFLFHKIITGEFKEGGMLPSENELCTAFGISRPVVRQALQRLRSDGLIVSRRGSGSFVQPRRPVDMSDDYTARKLRELAENLEFRSVVEPKAAFFASQRRTAADLDAMRAAVNEFEQVAVVNGDIGHHLDFRFHHAIAIAAGNRRFVDAIRAVEYDIDHAVNLVRYLVRFDHLERSRSVLAEHVRILIAIERQDADAAATAMREHLEQAHMRMIELRPDRTSETARSQKFQSAERLSRARDRGPKKARASR